MSITYIGFGSNLGDLLENLHKTVDLLAATPGLSLRATANLYRTEPITLTADPQPWYLNTVLQIETTLAPNTLLTHLKDIEHKLGRTPSQRWQPRTVDLDILFYDDLIIHTPDLQIPHPGIPLRRFVLAPLCDLDPQLLHPEHGITVKEMLDKVSHSQQVVPFHVV